MSENGKARGDDGDMGVVSSIRFKSKDELRNLRFQKVI
jgi:hypothetical protein